MKNKARNKQKQLESNLLAHSAHIKNRKDLEIYYNKHKHKLPPILQSKHMFMIQLINQETQANLQLTNRHCRQTQRNKTQQTQFKSQQKNKAQNTLRLNLSPGKIIFNVENPRKIRRDYLVSYSSVEREKNERRTLQRQKPKEIETQNRSTKMYSKKKQNNPFYVNRVYSQSLVQLVEKIESSKKLCEENSPQSLISKKTAKNQLIQNGKIINKNEAKKILIIPQQNSPQIRSHLKTCVFQKQNNYQFQRYPSKDLDTNFCAKRDKKLKLALTKPLESSLKIKQQLTPHKSHFKTLYQEIKVQPWQDQDAQFQGYL